MTKYAPMFPKSIRTVPKGKIAIHNHIDHHVGQKFGERGFRVWFDEPHDNYVECSCGWRPDRGTHYITRSALTMRGANDVSLSGVLNGWAHYPDLRPLPLSRGGVASGSGGAHY
jgi:hypothetical protein